MSLRTQIAITAVLTAVLAAGWLWFAGWGDAARSNESKQRKPAAATLVLVEPLALEADRLSLRVVGTGEALRSASIHPSVSGEVVKVAFEAEQRVKQGQVLLQLDSKHQRIAVRLAEVAVKEAGRQARRLQKLAPSGSASRARIETAEAAFESAKLRLAQARADLADRTVVAPFDGVIGLTEVDEGDRIDDGTMIATLDDRSVILVEFSVPEDFAARLTVGDPVAVRPWSMPEAEIQGTISAMGSRIDPVTRSLKLKAQIPNPTGTIRPGTSFEVGIAFEGRRYPSVREVAVLWSRDGAYLWRVSDGKAEKVFVQLVRRNDGRILVDGPLEVGDVIVVEGVQGLRIGQTLKTEPFSPNGKTGGNA